MSEVNEGRSAPRRVLTHLASMVAVSAILGVVVAGLAIPFAGVLGIGTRNVANSMNDLPESLETKALSQRTRILAADGTTIATLYDENRVNVSLNQVSRVMREAIVSIEDYRFYQHGALDVKGTLRALVTNKAAGGVVQGGSSITQQMVKLTLLSQAKTEKERKAAIQDTFARKVRELRYAIAFEQEHSKDWILERYLNIAYFGDGVYGIQAAARHYFSKDARKLNLRESAMLAGLVKNPVGLDPTVYPDRALSRRNVVLDRMAQLNVITQQQADKLGKRDLGLKLTPNRNGCMFSKAPFFCDYVVDYLKRDRSLGKTAAARQDLLLSGGLTIRTTIDLRFQKAADDSVKSHVFPREEAIGALAMVEPRTGNVRAVAQSRPMGRDKKAGETFINYTVPKESGGARGFQAGSTFKAFVLAAAIKQGIPMNTTINSPKEKTFQERDFEDCDGQPYGYGSFKIPNSTTSGNKNLYTGTRESVNTFFMALEQMTGLCDPFNLAKEMGVNLTSPTGGREGSPERVPTFTLGVADVTPLEMAEAYATFAGRGLHCSARPVTEIRDTRKNVVKAYPKQCQQVLPSSVADAVNDVLRGVMEPGGFGNNAGINTTQVSAGKTGTTNSQFSVWFVGYTPNLAAASMIAGANQEGSPDTIVGKQIGGQTLYEASGSGTAGPMWGDAMKIIEQWLPDVDFSRPAADEITGLLVPIPATYGMSIDKATSVLEDAGFTVAVGGEIDSQLDRGLIAGSYPRSGDSTSSGDTVTIYPSDGSPYVAPKPKSKPKKKGGGNGGGRG
jgi:membrane peptidoglycan carboxypeptidase